MNCCSHLDHKHQTNSPPRTLLRVSAAKFLTSDHPLRQLHRLSSCHVMCRPCHLLSQSLSMKSASCLQTHRPLAKSCSLDPVPTWFLKQITDHITPVICYLCNLSLQTGNSQTCIGPSPSQKTYTGHRGSKPLLSHFKFVLYIQAS